MKTLKTSREWCGKPAGEYRIPQDISMTHAKCARADGAGEIVEDASFRKPSRKGPAPENKAMGAAAENKADLAGGNGDSGGERAEPKRKPSRNRAPKRSADTGNK